MGKAAADILVASENIRRAAAYAKEGGPVEAQRELAVKKRCRSLSCRSMRFLFAFTFLD